MPQTDNLIAQLAEQRHIFVEHTGANLNKALQDIIDCTDRLASAPADTSSFDMMYDLLSTVSEALIDTIKATKVMLQGIDGAMSAAEGLRYHQDVMRGGAVTLGQRVERLEREVLNP